MQMTSTPHPVREAISYVIFGLGERELALPLRAVESVERPGRFTAVPFAAPWLKGVTSIRGGVVSVVDLGRFAGADPAGLTPSARLLVTRGGGRNAALLVDRVERIVSPVAALEPAPDGGDGFSDWWQGSLALDGRQVPVLDPDKLMTSPQFGAYQTSGVE